MLRCSSRQSIQKQIVLFISILGGILFVGGILVALVGRVADTEFTLFSQKFTSTSVGVALAFLGAVIVLLTYRRVLKSVDHQQVSSDNQSCLTVPSEDNPLQTTSSYSITFDRITLPRVSDSGKSVAKPKRYPFDIECSNYFEFGTVNPALDITIINHSDKPVLLTSIGIEVVSVAQSWLVGAVLEPRIIRVDALVKITMPDIWAKLKDQGRGRFGFNTNKPRDDDGLIKLSLEDILNIDVPPQTVDEKILYEIPDPVQLDINTPFRYILLLDKYLEHMPDEAILKLWVATNKGEYSSSPIYMFVLGNVMHAKAMTQEERVLENEVEPILEKANEYFNAHKYSQAKPLLERAVEIRENAQGREHPDVVSIRHNLGVLNYYLGQYSEAERIYKQTIPLKEKQLGPDHPEIVKCHHDLQLLHDVWEKRIEGARVILPEEGSLQMTNGFIEDWQRLEDTEQYDQAVKMGKKLISACEKHYDPDHKQLANLFNKMGALCWKIDSYEEAADYFGRGLKIRIQHYGDRSSAVANSYNNLASTYREQGSFEQSEYLYKQSIEILESLGEHKKLLSVLGYYETLLRMMKRKTDADNIQNRIMSIKKRET